MRVWIVALALMLAGCTGPYAKDLAPEQDRRPTDLAERWVFGGGPDLPTDGLEPRAAQTRLTGFDGPEPNMGITTQGGIFVSSMDNVVTPDASLRQWTSVYSFEPALGSGGDSDTADPMLWVDPVTDRIYASHMYPALLCMAVAWSDDEGQTWEENPESCTLPGLDHQKFFSAVPGPAAPPVAGAEYPTVAYQCYQRVVGTEPTGFLLSGYTTHCNMSYDGGATWPAETVSAARVQGVTCGGINGHPAASLDGIVAVPITRGCDGLYVSVSLDSGLTWTIRPGPKTVGAESIDPDLTFTPDGTMYAIWRGSDHLTYLARTGDLGVTWDGPWRVSPPHVTSTAFQVISSGDDGRIAMAFLGTDMTSEEPSYAPNGTLWHLYIVTSDNAAEDPVFDALKVKNPVQNGCVWLYGGGNPCRNMLDFIDSAVHPDGTFYVAFTQGCAGCTDPDDKARTSAVAWLEGFRLR